MSSKIKRLNLAITFLVVFVSFSVMGCSFFVKETETSVTLYQSGDLMSVYEIIHKAIPTDGNTGEYSSELIETDMYIDLFVYNSERLEADKNFEELTTDEVKGYLLNGEITLDYLNSNWELSYLEKCEYGMSDRVKDYFEWYWGEGAYATDDYSDYGSQKIVDYRIQLQEVINDLCEQNPNEIIVRTVYEMDIQQLTVLFDCNGDASAISEEDLSLFK